MLATTKGDDWAAQAAHTGRLALAALIVFFVLDEAGTHSDLLAAPSQEETMSEKLKEVTLDGKVVKLGMDYEAMRAALGTPKVTEPLVLDSRPAIRAVYYRGENYYSFYFTKDDQGKTTLSHIQIDTGL